MVRSIMSKIFIKRIFPFLAILLLTPWPVAYAHTYTGNMVGQKPVQIEVAEPSLAPSMSVFGRAVGGVSPGDLFYIDTTKAADITVNLYLTNARELIGGYRHLILKVGVYAKSASGEWDRASTAYGEPIPDTFITLRDAQASFILPGSAKHKITIDSGSFYCIKTTTDGGSLSPQFYLTVN